MKKIIFFILTYFLQAGYSQKPKGVQCGGNPKKKSASFKSTKLRDLEKDEVRVFLSQIKCGDCAIKLKKHFSEESFAGQKIYTDIEVDVERNFLSLKRNIKDFELDKTLIKELKGLGFTPLRAEVYGENKFRFYKKNQPQKLKKKGVLVEVDGMVCGFCARGIKEKLSELSGLKSIEVSFENKTLSLEIDKDKKISDKEIRTKISEAGYSVRSIKRGL